MARNVLVVTTVAADERQLGEQLRTVVGEGATNVRIVAPAANLSWLDWLTNDEDRARAEAAAAADRAAEALPDEASVEIDRASQDSDAAQTVADALRTFPADELVVVTRPGEEATGLEDQAVEAAFEQFGLPVRHLELPDEIG